MCRLRAARANGAMSGRAKTYRIKFFLVLHCAGVYRGPCRVKAALYSHKSIQGIVASGIIRFSPHRDRKADMREMSHSGPDAVSSSI
jgi:hypothetical protein